VSATVVDTTSFVVPVVTAPRVQQSDARPLEVLGVSRDEHQIVHDRGCRDQRIHLGKRIRNVQGRSRDRRTLLDGQDAASEHRPDVFLKPESERVRADRVTAFRSFKFQNGDDADVSDAT